MAGTGANGDDQFPEVRAALAQDPALFERVVTCDELWRGRIFSVELMDVELADGTHGRREIVRHHGGAGVVAIREGRVCLVRQYRVAQGRVTLEIPAGKIEGDEPGSACAARELMEETGLVASELVLLANVLGSPGFTDEHTEVFLARGLMQGRPAPDNGEVVKVVWIPVEQVLAAIRAGVIRDGKTVIGLMAARLLELEH